jgi:hypothetical protein
MADEPPVIALSRWRAALARARRTHRADALLAEPDAVKLVPQLPVQELYYAIKEVGLADAQELLALASPEQLRGFVDLDAWDRDHLDEQRLGEWLEALVDAGPETLGAAVEALDGESIALWLQRQAKVYDLTMEEAPEQSEGHFYPTPDRFFLLDILVEGERGKALERVIDWLYRADLGLARRVVMSARWELAADLEEHSYRWRSGRMADLGYADFYEALSVYRYLDPTSVKLDEGSAARTGEPVTLPVQLAAALDDQSFFARALGTLPDEAAVERMTGHLMVLVNRVMAADLIQPGDVEGAKAALIRAVGYLGLGLEYLGKGDLGRAGRALGSVALERIFRVGFSLTLQLQRLADDVWIVSLRRARPERPDGTFRTLEDIRAAALALEEAAEPAQLVYDRMGVTPEEIAARMAGAANPPETVRFGTLVRTLAAHRALGHAPSLEPLAGAPAARIPDEVRAELARGCAGAPGADRWLARWLAEPATDVLLAIAAL